MVFSDIDEDSNLRTEVDRLLRRVGITEDVPRFFQNARSSRQTELEEHFPTHVVCAWLGNSQKNSEEALPEGLGTSSFTQIPACLADVDQFWNAGATNAVQSAAT